MINGPVLEAVVPGEFNEVIHSARLDGYEKVWKKIEGHEDNPSDCLKCRDLLKYILAYLADITQPEPHTTDKKKPNSKQMKRLKTLIHLASQMQIPEGECYAGSFYKTWGDRNVYKYDPQNVVAFCMFNVTIIWQEFHEVLPNELQDVLRKMMQSALGLVKNDDTPPKYTNMFLLNIFDLIQLGDILGDAAATAEGNARFDRFMIYTWEWGIHEYVSPTYTGIQLNVVMMLERFCRQKRDQARALLEFYWVYIIVNWISHLERLVGAESRQISNYLNNKGILNIVMQALGLAGNRTPIDLQGIHATFAQWKPSEALMDASNRRGLIRHTWGPLLNQSRTVCSLDDVALSVSGDVFDILAGGDRKGYGVLPQGAYAETEDVLLAADFRKYTEFKGIYPGSTGHIVPEGDHLGPSLSELFPGRMYFIPDIADDPYGIKDRTHLNPTHWAAAQTYVDALGLALYAPNNAKKSSNSDSPHLYSHFVLPMVTQAWVGTRQMAILGEQEDPKYVRMGESIVLFYKNQPTNTDGNVPESRATYTALGLKVLWAGDLAGKDIKDEDQRIAYHFHKVKDKMPVMRLAVNHSVENPATGTAGVLVWVRVGSNLTEERCQPWRETFAAAVPDLPQGPFVERKTLCAKKTHSVEKFEAIQRANIYAIDSTGGHLGICSELGEDGVTYTTTVAPPFSQSVLEWNYEDVGRECLRGAPLIQRYEKSHAGVEKVYLPEVPPKESHIQKTVRWEAENGLVWLPMVAAWHKPDPDGPQVPRNQRELGHWYVWMDPNSIPSWQKGSDVGNVGWRLEVPKQGGTYYIWARVKTYGDHVGAFMVRVFQGRERQSLILQAPWHMDAYNEWAIVPLVLGAGNVSPAPSELKLPPGAVTLQFFALKWGTQIDCLYATTDPEMPLECIYNADGIDDVH